MRLQDIMATDVQAVTPEEDIERAWTQMRVHRIHHLVVMEDRRVVGILSDRDLGSSRGELLRKGLKVRDVMTPHPIMATPTTDLRRGANLLRGHVIGCLPVVDRGRLLGIVTTADLLEAIGRETERPVVRGKRWTLKHRGPRHQKTHTPNR
jgi:acetoin utilization protein AcuB